MTIKRQWTGRLEIESHLIAAHGYIRAALENANLDALHNVEHEAEDHFVFPHEHEQVEA